MKTALVHDWLVTYAGSERCLESFVNLYPDSDIFTLINFLNAEEKKVIINNKETTTSFIQKLPWAKNNHRNYLPLFPYAIEQFDLSNYDLILSSSHAVAKGVLTNANQLHICYCHTPIRYAWDLTHQYLNESNLTKGIKGFIVKSILHYIRLWDISSVNRVDYFIANSNYIAKRIKKVYNRDAEVIYPPVDTEKFKCESNKENYYLTASRFVPYKKIDLIVESFTKMPDKKLIVIGDGPDSQKIKSRAGKNIEFLGYQTGKTLESYLQKAKAFVFAAEEDFGIMVIEALSCGTPVIALNKGGTAETIIDLQNGIHFENQSIEDIIEAVKKFENNEDKFDSMAISGSAKKYDRKSFEQKIQNFIDKKVKEFYG